MVIGVPVALFLVHACNTSSPSPTGGGSGSTTYDSPSIPTAPPTQAKAGLGATIRVTTHTVLTGGGTVNGTATYTVANLRPATPANEYIPVKGNLYSVTVTIQVESGEVIVHPWYFAARTEDGTSCETVLGSVNYELPATHVPQGQKVSGQVGFDVPPGKTITQIIFTDAMTGPQLALWTVP
jgi:hypothetical protein